MRSTESRKTAVPQNDGETIREQNCLGYFGFGSGWAAQRIERYRPIMAAGACDRCPERSRCLSLHRQRVHALMPQATELYERLSRHLREGELRAEFRVQSGLMGSPYQIIANGNTEDGIAVGLGATVKPRGKGTLPYPFGRPN